MNKLEVNLLPKDVLQEKKQNVQFILIKKISITCLIVTVIISSISVALRLVQQKEYNSVNEKLLNNQNTLITMAEKEGQAWLIKNRLNAIEELLGGDQKKKEVFKVITGLIPPTMNMNDFFLDKGNSVVVSLSANSPADMDTLFANLASATQNKNLVSTVDFDGLTMNQDQVYRFSLKIKTKSRQ